MQSSLFFVSSGVYAFGGTSTSKESVKVGHQKFPTPKGSKVISPDSGILCDPEEVEDSVMNNF